MISKRILIKVISYNPSNYMIRMRVLENISCSNTVVWKGKLLIFCFLNFFASGISLGYKKRPFRVFGYKNQLLRPKMALESVGFEPTTTFCQSQTLKSVIFNFNFHTHTSMCQRSYYYLEVAQNLNFYGEKVSTLLNFAESGNNSLKFGKIAKSSKKL